jgi:pimeloyl-ACP methyl ester carboxylesterase
VQTQYFKRPQGALAYSDYGGSGDLVLMLPGMGALRSEYRCLAPRLSQAGYHAITVDLRGHGESSVPWPSYDVPSVGGDILAMIEHLNVGPVHLICTSKAAGSGVWAAAEPSDFPDPVAEGQFIAAKTGGRLELIKGAGHYPQTEMPEKTIPLVMDFLKTSVSSMSS